MNNTLSKEDIADLRDLFNFYNRSSSGTIPTNEVLNIVKNSRFWVDEKETRKLMGEIDPGKKGVTFEQLLGGLQRKRPEGDPKAELLEAFKVFDRDGSGTVSTSALIDILSKLKAELGVTECEIAQLVRDVDFDGDGQIEYGEFVKMLFEVEELS